jgi:hypothetical protein
MDSIKQEKRELDLLLQKGVEFEVEQTYYKRLGYFRAPVKVTKKVKYKIQEPTLAVLDRMAAEQIDLVIDEGIMISEAGINEAKKLAAKHARRLARIVAIAVMGEEYTRPVAHGSGYKYVCDEKGLNRLTDTFLNCIKPSKLLQLTILINTISNLGDFTNSIRLMSAARTTMPSRIEEDKKG